MQFYRYYRRSVRAARQASYLSLWPVAIAFMEQNPAKLRGVMAASAPPAIITSAFFYFNFFCQDSKNGPEIVPTAQDSFAGGPDVGARPSR